MKNRLLFFIIPIIFSISCNRFGWKELDLKAFTISVPRDWQYQKQKSIDSFAGNIVGKKIDLGFDYSGMGYSNSLIPTEKEYLDYVWFHLHNLPDDPNEPVSIPEGQKPLQFAALARKAELQNSIQLTNKKNRPDTVVTLTKNINQLVKGLSPDYIAIVQYGKKSDTVPITIPIEIKQQNIIADTNGRYVTKTIWPRVSGHGMTGVFIYRTDSDFTFCLSGRDLPANEQALALQAFRTIKFK